MNDLLSDFPLPSCMIISTNFSFSMECLFCVFLGHDLVHLSFRFQVLWPGIIVINRGCWCSSMCFRTSSRSTVTFLIPLFKPCLPRASGEELSAGRYVHLVMARLLFWSGAAVRLRSKGSLEREAPPGVSWDSSWLLGSSFLSLFSYVLLF